MNLVEEFGGSAHWKVRRIWWKNKSKEALWNTVFQVQSKALAIARSEQSGSQHAAKFSGKIQWKLN